MRSFLLMGQLIIEFMLKLAGIAATLAIIVGGFLYVFALGKPEKAKQAKSIITSTLIGFVVVFIAWAVVASILTTLGYIDPLDGVWYAI